MTLPRAGAPLALAVDLGGTKVEAALVDADGRIVDGTRSRAATGPSAASDARAGEAALRHVVRAAIESPHWSEVRAVGVGSAGPLDLAAGTVSPVNLPAMAGFEIVRVLGEIADRPVTLRLDGTCIALAERWQGAARDVDDAIVLVISTGVGGGIVSGGRLISGGSGNAGHLGQTIVDRIVGDDAANATLERIASGPATVAWARGLGWPGADGEALAAAYRDGDHLARHAVHRSADAVAVALASTATLLDLDLAVIGGGFSFVADDYIERIQEGARARSVNAFARRLRVMRAELGADAPLIGAAALVHRPDLLV